MLEAKSNLSRLVKAVSSGAESEIIIAIDGRPAAKLVPYGKPRRVLGIDQGAIVMSPDFNDVDVEIAALFEGR